MWDSNIFSYITQHIDESSGASSQHIFRGISEAQPLPKFDGNVLVEFSPNPKLGISIPTFLDICALDPHTYVKKFGDLLETQDPSSFSRQIKVIKSVLSNECELAVSRPIPSCCVHSIVRIKLSETGYSMMGSPSRNPKYNPEKFQYPGDLKECLLFAIKNDLFKT